MKIFCAKVLSVLVFSCFLAKPNTMAQADSARLSNSFNFKDGIYLRHASFLANTPDLTWEEVDAELVVNPDSYQARLGYVKQKETGAQLPFTSIWGLSKDGVPYIRVEPEKQMEGASHFSGLEFTGRISYFGYPDDSTSLVKITAYNPLTGKPFREGKVSRKDTYLKEFIMLSSTGEVRPLSWENLIPWIENDQELMQQAKRVRQQELDLIRIIQAFDRRHPLYLKFSE